MKTRRIIAHILFAIAALLAAEAVRCWVHNTPALAWWVIAADHRRLATLVGFAGFACALAHTLRSPVPGRLPAWHFFLYVFALSLTNGRYVGSGDCEPARLLPFVALREHRLTFEGSSQTPFDPAQPPKEYVRSGERVASKFPVATALLAIPVYLPAAMGSFSPAREMPFELERLAAAMLAALSLCFLRPVFRRFSDSDAAALIVCALYAFGTSFLTIFSKALWQHTGAAFGLSLAMYGLFVSPPRTRGLLVGLGAGLALACRPVDIVLSAGVLLALWLTDRRQAVVAAALTTACGAAVALYNFVIFGAVTASGYGTEAGAFTAPFAEGFAGVLFSPARGLLLYTPALGFAGVAMYRAHDKATMRVLIATSLAFIVLMAKWWCWWGGYCADSRMVCDILPLLSVGLALAWQSTPWRRYFQLACAWGIAVHVLLAYVGGNAYVRGLFWAVLEGPWDLRSFAPITYLLGIFLRYTPS